MQSKLMMDSRIIEEMIKFGENVARAPRMVAAPDEISMGVTPHDIVQNVDKTRLLHYTVKVKFEITHHGQSVTKF